MRLHVGGEIGMSEGSKLGLGCMVFVLAIVGLIFLGRAISGVDAPPEEGNACSNPGERVVDEEGNELYCR